MANGTLICACGAHAWAPCGRKGQVTLVDAEDAPLLERPWSYNGWGYAHAEIGGKWVKLHRIVMKAKARQIVDHVNRWRTDNRKGNLRFATATQNQANRASIGSVSGYKGVQRNGNNWQAVIQFKGKRKCLGTFKRAIDAAKRYDEVARKYFGDFGVTNFPLEAH